MTATPNNNYNPHDHLIEIRDKQGGMKKYYPASWRLYELRLKHPTITIESEIIHMDPEHNFVIIKASIFDGKTYEESSMRASSLKQGLLSSLDKVETGAKARAVRDFGISTELALSSEEEEEGLDTPTPAARSGNNARGGQNSAAPRAISQNSSAPTPVLKWSSIYQKGAAKGMWTKETFYATASALLDGIPVSADTVKSLSQEQLHKLHRDVERYQAQEAS